MREAATRIRRQGVSWAPASFEDTARYRCIHDEMRLLLQSHSGHQPVSSLCSNVEKQCKCQSHSCATVFLYVCENHGFSVALGV